MQEKAKVTIELPGGFTKTIEGDAAMVLVHTGEGINGCTWANADLNTLLNMLSAIEKSKKDLLKSNPILAVFGESLIEKMAKTDNKGGFDDLFRNRRGGVTIRV